MSDKTTAQQALFQFQFTLMMIMVGRTDEAQQSASKTEDLLNQLIEEGH